MDSENRIRYEWIALRCQSGEPGAFEDLIAVMERPLLYYATSLTGNADSGLDVLQDVWIKVFRSIRKLKDPGSLRSWLYTITHGIAADRIRRNSAVRMNGYPVWKNSSWGSLLQARAIPPENWRCPANSLVTLPEQPR